MFWLKCTQVTFCAQARISQSTSMTQLADLISEMNCVSALIASRNAVESGGPSSRQLQPKLASSMASKISQLPIVNPNGARELLVAVGKSSYGTSQSIVIAAIDAKLQQQLDAEPETKYGKRNQLLDNCQHYVTASFMDSMNSPRLHIDVKLQTAAEFLANTLGCTHPHEQTFKHWLTLVLLSHFEKWPSYRNVYAFLNQLKSDVASCRKSCSFSAPAKYPRVPHELPEATFEHIYKDTQPIVVTIDRFAVTAQAHVPLRKNSKLLISEQLAIKNGQHIDDSAPARNHTHQQPAHSTEAPAPTWAQELLRMLSNQNDAQSHRINASPRGGSREPSPSPASTRSYLSPSPSRSCTSRRISETDLPTPASLQPRSCASQRISETDLPTLASLQPRSALGRHDFRTDAAAYDKACRSECMSRTRCANHVSLRLCVEQHMVPLRVRSMCLPTYT